MKSEDKKTRIAAMRSSSSAFISRKDVRKYILSRDGYKCAVCGSDKNLTIDHIRSVYRVAAMKEDFALLNDESNLRVLCNKCNAGKRPEE